MAEMGLKGMITYFNTETRPMTSAEFVRDWKTFTDEDKADFRKGFEDGSLTY